MSKKKQPKPSTGTSKTGKPTPEEVASLLPPASPDDPIFTRGFVIGGRFPSARRAARTTRRRRIKWQQLPTEA